MMLCLLLVLPLLGQCVPSEWLTFSPASCYPYHLSEEDPCIFSVEPLESVWLANGL